MHDTYNFKDRDGNFAGQVTIYRQNLNIGKVKSLESKYKDFKQLLKTEQFATIDGLLQSASDKLAKYIKETEDHTEKIKLQNKYDGLNNIKRKIEIAKKEYADNPQNKLAYNKVLNLYNSLKNLL